jgi:hypothetical protein
VPRFEAAATLNCGVGDEDLNDRVLVLHGEMNAPDRPAAVIWGFLAQTTGTVTPTISPSRTIAANCSALQPSVPAGRFGSTIQR